MESLSFLRSKRARAERLAASTRKSLHAAASCVGLFSLALGAAPRAEFDRGCASSSALESLSASTEYSVKAAFLLNSARYVKWPEGAFEDKSAPLVVGVIGKSPFDKLLEDTFRGKRINDRALVVKYFENRAALKTCHILFVPESEESGLEQIEEHYEDQPVLLVSESIAAALRGAQVGLYIQESKLCFAINDQAAKRVNLEVSSELLKLAKIVKADTQERE